MNRWKYRQNAVDWIVGAFLTLTLLAYPFFVKFFFHTAYQAAVFIIFVCASFLVVVWGKFRIPTSPRNYIVALFIASYVLYLIMLSIASLHNIPKGYSSAPLVRALMKFAIGIILLTQVRWLMHKFLLARYVDLMSITSIMALALIPLTLFGIIAPIYHLNLETASGGGSLREVYPLGMTWGGIWLGDGRILARLQSFSDEPGTYAFGLLPAMAWAIATHRWKSLCALFVALLGTLSAGAIPIGIAVSAVMLWRHFKNGKLIVVWGVASMIAVFLLIITLPQTSYLSNYFLTKVGFGDATTSLGLRMKDMGTALDIISESPFGLGAGSLGNAIKVPIGIGFGEVLGDAGFVGLTFYLVSTVALVAMASRLLLFEKLEFSALGGAMLCLCFGAIQRARWDESFWHWWFIALVLFAYGRIRRPTE